VVRNTRTHLIESRKDLPNCQPDFDLRKAETDVVAKLDLAYSTTAHTGESYPEASYALLRERCVEDALLALRLHQGLEKGYVAPADRILLSSPSYIGRHHLCTEDQGSRGKKAKKRAHRKQHPLRRRQLWDPWREQF